MGEVKNMERRMLMVATLSISLFCVNIPLTTSLMGESRVNKIIANTEINTEQKGDIKLLDSAMNYLNKWLKEEEKGVTIDEMKQNHEKLHAYFDKLQSIKGEIEDDKKLSRIETLQLNLEAELDWLKYAIKTIDASKRIELQSPIILGKTFDNKISTTNYGGTIIGEVGKVIGLDHTWKEVQLQNEYTNPVVIAQPASHNGGDPGHIRLKDISSHSFRLKVEEWKYLDGQHTKETVSYIVIEAGSYSLPDGTRLEAGKKSVSGEYNKWTFFLFLRIFFPHQLR